MAYIKIEANVGNTKVEITEGSRWTGDWDTGKEEEFGVVVDRALTTLNDTIDKLDLRSFTASDPF